MVSLKPPDFAELRASPTDRWSRSLTFICLPKQGDKGPKQKNVQVQVGLNWRGFRTSWLPDQNTE